MGVCGGVGECVDAFLCVLHNYACVVYLCGPL